MSTENILEILSRRNLESVRNEINSSSVMEDSLKVSYGWRELGLFITGGGADLSDSYARIGQGGKVVGK